MTLSSGGTMLMVRLLPEWRLFVAFNVSLTVLLLEYLVLILIIWRYRIWKNNRKNPSSR